jgi:hypothetical protein
MKLLRLSTLSLTLAIAVMTLGYVNPASAAPPGGFKLTGTDAAYADWLNEDVDGCSANLFVGFVETDKFQQPLGSKPRPHSDVNADLAVDCPLNSWNLAGVTSAGDCGSLSMDSLVSASVSCDVTISEPGGAVAIVTINGLSWTAEGPVFTWTSHGRGIHATHRTRTATVTGYVTIAFAVTLADFPGLVEFDAADVDDARITHYNEIQIALP